MSELAAWAERSLEAGETLSAFEIPDAIKLLNKLELEGDLERPDFSGRMIQAASAGVAAVLARFGSSDLIESHIDWTRERLLGAISRQRSSEESQFLTPGSLMSFDPQTMAAGGVSALVSRGFLMDIDATVAELSTHQLHAVCSATLRGLDWEQRPEFAWRCLVAALDNCVFDSGYDWETDRRKRRAEKINIKRQKNAVKLATGRSRNRGPVLPPKPYRTRWVRSKKVWPPAVRVKLREQRYFHWGKLKTLLEAVPYAAVGKPEREYLFKYFEGLTEWARFIRDEDGYPTHLERWTFADHGVTNTQGHQNP